MSAMFDAENAAIYPFPPKPARLSAAGKSRLHREEIKAPAQGTRCGDGGALLHRSGDPGAGRRDRRLRGGLARDGALRQPACGAERCWWPASGFMGETAKIHQPGKNRADAHACRRSARWTWAARLRNLIAFCDAHPDRTVVVYANTSAAVKARADWVVTSSIAVELNRASGQPAVRRLSGHRTGIWGATSRQQSGADVLCWQGACIVHDEFKTQALQRMKALYPDAAVLVHPGVAAGDCGTGRCGRLDQPADSGRQKRCRIRR